MENKNQEKELKKMTLEEFVCRFAKKKNDTRKYCFILGAGASISSGIHSGETLARNWIKDLKEMWNDDKFNKWIKKESIDVENPAAKYSEIYEKRFDDNFDSDEGYAYIYDQMKNAEPSCGYSFLAEILATTKNNIVITTNFDSLTEDALFIYTQKKQDQVVK